MDIKINKQKVTLKLAAAGLPANMLEIATLQVLDILQSRVAMRLEEELSDKELVDFQQYAEQESPERGIDWLVKRFPNYDRIVDEELDIVVNDLKRTVEGIKNSQ
jgi:Protein of unknown function (DUF5663)